MKHNVQYSAKENGIAAYVTQGVWLDRKHPDIIHISVRDKDVPGGGFHHALRKEKHPQLFASYLKILNARPRRAA